MIDLHVHDFTEDDLSVGFGIIDTLPNFVGIQLCELKVHSTNGVDYYLPFTRTILGCGFQASSKDSYGAENNYFKDIDKINYLMGNSRQSILHTGTQRNNSVVFFLALEIESPKRNQSLAVFFLIL
ncbi:hypothetical protein P5G49_01630 [Sporosarcina sp. F6_3S_P_2]|uniref:Uncharacterized protein n=1 Tax=Sporosarcina highlanderae TaxID=3035916 RepID=A0ABT8JMZ0_9BACL|nr:hypothetical protein [Sporosarcina highlanderae]